MSAPVPKFPAAAGSFATTRWSIVQASSGAGGDALAALDRLCQDYWAPVHAHVLHRVGNVHLAEDLTQEFFSRFVSQGWFLRPCRKTGKFRTFLLTILHRFLSDERRRAHTWKRGGRSVTLSLDELPDVARADGGCSHFDRAWAAALMDRAVRELRRESDGGRFDALLPFLQREPDHGEYRALADSFALTPNTVAAAVRRLRRRFRDLLREEVRKTLAVDENVDEEMRHLLQVLAA